MFRERTILLLYVQQVTAISVHKGHFENRVLRVETVLVAGRLDVYICSLFGYLGMYTHFFLNILILPVGVYVVNEYRNSTNK